MVRFLHTADWQLGMTRHFLSQDAQARFSAARLDVIERIGDLALKENCEFVLVCGDVFESNHVERSIVARALEKMASTPEVTFFLLPGNHDTLDASSVYWSSVFTQRCPKNVKVLEGCDPVQAAPGVALIPAPWPNKHPNTDLIGAACEGLEPTDGIRIVVGHGAVDVMSPDRDDPKLVGLERVEEKVEAGLVNYVALGDRHSTTDVGVTGRVWYSGAPEPTSFAEVDPGNVLIVDLNANTIEVDKHQLGTWRFLTSEWDVGSDEDLEAVDDWFAAIGDKDRTVVRVSVRGGVSISQMARLQEMLEFNADLLGALVVSRELDDLVVIPDTADLEHFALSGFANDALGELRQMAESGEQAVVARDALALLHRLAGPAT